MAAGGRRQAHPVHVVHLLTKDSIEERAWETLKLKKSLFAGVFDSPTGEVPLSRVDSIIPERQGLRA
jgi:SNF2 family DNA or RNA helicase